MPKSTKVKGKKIVYGNYYSPKELAALEEVNIITIYTWCQRGLIACKQLPNGRWIIDKEKYIRPEIPNWHRDNPKNRKKKQL